MDQQSDDSRLGLAARIFVAGHRGLVGSAILRKLQEKGYQNLVFRTHNELDLTDQRAVAAFFEQERPEYVCLAAARVGGILANITYPADFIYDNLAIQTNVIEQAYRHRVKRLLFLGSSCIYPRGCSQPIKEEYLLSGPLEPTNEAYAIAKIAGVKMCDAYNRQYGTRYLAVMPTNLYGPNDNFDLEGSHVIPALLRKFHDAKETSSREVSVWGTGQVRREFLYVDDLADACLFLLSLEERRYQELLTSNLMPIINVGCGSDMTICDLARMISEIVGADAEIGWDTSKPDGTPQKLLDISRIKALGWMPSTDLWDGLRYTYQWYQSNIDLQPSAVSR